MIAILTWVSIISGGILVLMLLLSLFGGLDIDLDVDVGSADMDTDSSGGFGLVKGILTFVSVSAWVIKVLLATNSHPSIAIGIGVLSGIAAFFLLNYILQLLLRNEENVNWEMADSLYQTGEVYLKIPGEEGSGIVQIDIKGAMRELKARTNHSKDIPTGTAVKVVDIDGEYVLVQEIDY